MAKSWQDVATQQVDLISNRLRELLSSGLGLLRSELGVDLGLNPEIYPSWVILLTAFIGLLLIVVSWAAACSGLFGGRKRAAAASEEISDSTKAPLTKAVKPEEQKKKNKKKPVEKKSQPNGHTPPEPHEEVKVEEEVQQQSPDIKTEKVKKKKKSKTEVKQVPTVSSPEGKETDEGAWETKVSNREKRQQRRKDKVPGDGSGSPGGADPPVGAPVEPPVTVAPTSLKKNRVESHVKSGKGDAIISQVSASWSEASPVNGGGWTDMVMKVPAPVSSSDREKWPNIMKEAGRRNPESRPWGQDTEGGEPVPPPAADLQWDNSPAVDDQWSGFNGMEAVDPGSDWNAPSELWGNYEEPQPDSPAPPKDSAPEAMKVSDDEREKGDASGGASGKAKKKKKKKKKQDEAGAAVQESEEVEKEATAAEELRKPVQETLVAVKERISVAESVSQKPSSQVPQVPPAKQSSTPPASQKKSEESCESPKQVQKKKKARRET